MDLPEDEQPQPMLVPMLVPEPLDSDAALPAIINELRIVQEQRIYLIAQVADFTVKLRVANARIAELETEKADPAESEKAEKPE